MMKSLYSIVVPISIFALPIAALAAPPKPSTSKYEVKIKDSNQLIRDIDIEVTGPSGAVYNKTIDCYAGTPGVFKKTKKGDVIKKLSEGLDKAKAPLAKLKAEVKKYKKRKDKVGKKLYKKAVAKFNKANLKYQDLAALQAEASAACNAPGYLSLAKYKGNFGTAEAQVLCNRFLFGCTNAELQYAASIGLDAFVDQITTPVAEPGLDADFEEMKCDGRLAAQSNNEACDPFDPNDLYIPGLRYAYTRYALVSSRPLFWKLFMFYHDEFMAGSTSALDGCERFAAVDHFNLLRNMSFSGDFRAFMASWDSDQLGNLKWLDGADNVGFSPNENYAREKWELGTLGVSDANGNPTYNDLDIAESARAHAGWQVQYKTLELGGNSYGVCLKGFFEGLASQGPKTIFNGQPYQATVYNAADVLAATLAHPATAENIARKILREFVNPYGTPLIIKQLAKQIRASNYNLMPAIKTVMKSRAMFAPESRRTLIKDSNELLLGFFRATGIPLADPNYPAKYDYEWLDYLMGDLDQRLLQPQTIFGFYPEAQAGASEVPSRRNVFNQLMLQSESDLESKNFRFADIISDMPRSASGDAYDVVSHLGFLLGIPLNENQKQQYVQYLTYDAQQCTSSAVQQGKCSSTSQPYYLQLKGFVADSEFENFDKKIRGLILMMTRHPLFGMK
jgi:hypothetical protein